MSEHEDGLAMRQNDIGATLTLKEGALFLLADQSGDIPPQTGPGTDSGLGLYFHDMRHLDEAVLRVNGARLTTLLASTELGNRGVREMSNPELPLPGGRTLPKGVIGLHTETTLDVLLRETHTARNYGREPAQLTLTLAYDAHFDDMFSVRGVRARRRGVLRPPEVLPDGLRFRYDGADGHRRTTTVTFAPVPTRIAQRCANFALPLAPGAAWSCDVTIAVTDEHDPMAAPDGVAIPMLEARPQPTVAPENLNRLEEGTQIVTSSELFNRVLRRCFLDLGMLAMEQGGDHFFAAGVPWYVALFGRDSLITALQTLAFAPGIARTTLDVLARHQGTRTDPARDEEPGKILHELRVGEMANLGEVPFTPYYGTIDATPLFLILLGDYLRWTGDRAYFQALSPGVEAALNWLDRHGDLDGDGFLEYACQAERGLANQGWKDAANAIVDADGSLAASPVALVEVQGYAYRARRAMADAYRWAGQEARAIALERQADQLYRRFNERF